MSTLVSPTLHNFSSGKFIQSVESKNSSCLISHGRAKGVKLFIGMRINYKKTSRQI